MLGIFSFVKRLLQRLCGRTPHATVPPASAAREQATARKPMIESVESRLHLSGNGLSATYFNNADLTGSSISRIDATVNFDWGTGSPNSAIGADTFSARWTGQVQAQKNETYTFFTTSDDGVRLWIDGRQIINDWSVHSPREDKGTIHRGPPWVCK